MTSPHTFKRYPAAWFELFDKLKETLASNEEHVIECPNEERAKAVRSEFYKARAAFLKDDGLRAEYEGALNSRKVLVRGNKVIFGFKDENWIAKLILDSLHKPS